MKIWVLLAIAVVLLVWSLSREGFTETSSIKAPPYFETDHRRIYNMLAEPSKKTLMDKVKVDMPLVTDVERLEAAAGALVSPAVESFFTQVYRPATQTITVEAVDTFMKSRSGALKDIEKEAVTQYFITQVSVAEKTDTKQGSTAGGTTGGSSTTSAAPNAGPVGSSGKGQSVYGPVFTSLGGEPPRDGGKDTSKTNQYPELLGGLGDTTSVRTPSGIQGPSQSWLLSQSGSLPSTASLGSDANSGYLPYSRVPGDQDLIPDPYRLSRNYSTASYSSKTDPVPFLTDFSAFQK
jgi:hypothetical protein